MIQSTEPYQQPLFLTGTGTGIGKTVAAAIVTEALQAGYWKPIQAGLDEGADALQVKALLSNTASVVYPELYRLALPASPHLAARAEGMTIRLELIRQQAERIQVQRREAGIRTPLVIEGAGGLLVPLNEQAFVADLIQLLDARVILVSRNYLGSINHSLLTAAYCKQRGLNVAGWLFNDHYMDYTGDIVGWTGYPLLGCLPFALQLNQQFVREQAALIRSNLLQYL